MHIYIFFFPKSVLKDLDCDLVLLISFPGIAHKRSKAALLNREHTSEKGLCGPDPETKETQLHNAGFIFNLHPNLS